MKFRKFRLEAELPQFAVARDSGINRVRLSMAENNELKLTPEEEAAVKKAIIAGIEQKSAYLRQLHERLLSTQQTNSAGNNI